MGQGCRSSGVLTTTGVQVVTGRTKLVSIHATNFHPTDVSTITVYDNTAASGKIVAVMQLPALDHGGGVEGGGWSMEYDMHSVICEKGIHYAFTNGTPFVTIEYA